MEGDLRVHICRRCLVFVLGYGTWPAVGGSARPFGVNQKLLGAGFESGASALDLLAGHFGHAGWVCAGALAAAGPSVLTSQPEKVGKCYTACLEARGPAALR